MKQKAKDLRDKVKYQHQLASANSAFPKIAKANIELADLYEQEAIDIERGTMSKILDSIFGK